MAKSMLLSTAILLAIFNGINALPAETAKVYPEVIPGPGLPSLASLGLTSADLYTMTPEFGDLVPREDISLEKRWNAACQTFSTCNVDDAIACFNYLVAIGNEGATCGTSAANVIMCTSGTAQISGANLFPGENQVVPCGNNGAANGVQWSFTNCNVNGQVGGQAAAYGNGNLIMGTQNISWNGKKAKKLA